MKKYFISLLIVGLTLPVFPVLSQTGSEVAQDTALLGLPGDNLDLFAVLNLFQKSKTIEEFEKTLNAEKTGINNLDLNLDKKVDFIKVTTKQNGDDFTFILQVDVTEKEVQDVAVILVSKGKDKKITMQIVGDKELYGDNYVIEPAAPEPKATANPGYTGTETAAPAAVAAPSSAPAAVTVAPASTTVVVVEQAPVVQYVYSPAYVPYYPPYYYGFYPPYFAAFTVMAVGIYRHNNYYHHGGYHGGYGNTVVVHNTNNYNNYNNSRNTSNTVNHNKASGNYNASRGSSAGAKPSATPSNKTSKGSSAKASATPSNNASRGTSASPSSTSRSSSGTRSSAGSSRRMGGGGGRRR